ncbi:tetratricopeptide repeat protein [Pseudohaliea sp.]|uniref:tetratricopeptide repeat protein n=1 Tax=Pseudohaliea sp. TaxID=2740289 RepID=UPI0032EF593B
MERSGYDPQDPQDARGGFPEAAIRQQLDRLRNSDTFARAHRLQNLLAYLVEHSLTPGDRELHEAIIGIEHFQRGSDFDCQSDTIVRVNARRLRDRLADYYRQEGAADAIRFEIPKGRYRVVFHPGLAGAGPKQEATPQAAPPAPLPSAVQGGPALPLSEPSRTVAPASPGSAAPRPQAKWRPGSLAALAALLLVAAGLGLVVPDERGLDQRKGATGPMPALTPPGVEEELRLGAFFYGRRADGDIALALSHFERAVALDESVPDAWVGVAKCIRLLWLNEHALPTQEALARQVVALRTALSLEPLHAEAHARIATVYRWLGDREAAARAMALAERHGRENPEALSMISGYRALQGDLDGAIAAVTAARTLEPTNAVYRINLGQLLLDTGRREEARAELLNARRLTPGVGETERGLVEVLLELGRPEEAREVADAMSPGADATLAAALVAGNEGRFDAAFAALEDLARGAASDSALAVRGYLYLGELERAVACLERERDQLLAREGPGVPAIYHLYGIRLSQLGARASGHPGWERWWQGAGLVAREDGSLALL